MLLMVKLWYDGRFIRGMALERRVEATELQQCLFDVMWLVHGHKAD